ncbi:MAG: LptA/OstA family protein [Armatimonadota bacterium]|nr:LptA/OstA family protein [Armatimonadota bacterium]MDR7422352.1 LptA/OstA family protein [Armatimonadota bacterium]MDR7454048.1 LptA/OstA family protein [Armatimonadota bacterium]MDR7457281.1 LptA/OstA family protein [Armatimonadota bacterium]MDR7497157.1 LptA/OstA family protein [Armatimonadota bacterium]
MSPRPSRRCAAALAGLAALLALRTAAAAPAPSPGPASPVAAPIEISGATRVEYDDRSGQLHAEGAPVVVTRGRTELRAPRVRYDGTARTISASGGAALSDPELVMRAQTVEYRLADETVRAAGEVRMTTRREDAATALEAPVIEGSLRTRRFVATGGVRVARGEWSAEGRRLDYDDRGRTAVLTGEPVARHRDATLRAERITFLLDQEVARAEGGVEVRRGTLVGYAPRAEVFGRDNRAVLAGGARVDRGADRVVAEVIEIDLEASRVTARGASRVVVNPSPTPTRAP